MSDHVYFSTTEIHDKSEYKIEELGSDPDIAKTDYLEKLANLANAVEHLKSASCATQKQLHRLVIVHLSTKIIDIAIKYDVAQANLRVPTFRYAELNEWCLLEWSCQIIFSRIIELPVGPFAYIVRAVNHLKIFETEFCRLVEEIIWSETADSGLSQEVKGHWHSIKTIHVIEACLESSDRIEIIKSYAFALECQTYLERYVAAESQAAKSSLIDDFTQHLQSRIQALDDQLIDAGIAMFDLDFKLMPSGPSKVTRNYL